jgi:hypothetical protein
MGLGGLVLAGMAVLLVVWFGRGFSPALRSPAQPTPDSPAPDAPVILTGVGSQTTRAFHLAGGTYHSVWSAWGQAAEFPPCTHSVELRAADPANASASNGHVTDLAKLVSVPATGASQERDIAGVRAGDYYLDVASACSWQIELTAQ